jgi:SAM-dependent methyltransferase
MNTATTTPEGSAERWGPLWGARPRDWVVIEEQQLPTYEAAISRVGLHEGQRVLEVGCERVPEADLHQGDMQFLPFADETFDVVAGFNSFFFAQDLVAAVREAGRVARPGAAVVIQVWGRHDRNSLEATKVVARPYFPPPPPGAVGAPELCEPGVLEGIAAAAGLTPGAAFDISWPFVFDDDAQLLRAMLSVAGLASIDNAEEEAEVRARILEALAPHRHADGSYRLDNEYHFLIATA